MGKPNPKHQLTYTGAENIPDIRFTSGNVDVKQRNTHRNQFDYHYTKEIPAPRYDSGNAFDEKNGALEAFGILFAIALTIGSGVIVYLQLVEDRQFASWIYITALVICIISLVTMLIAILISLFHSGSFFDWWIMGDAIEAIIKIIGYLIIAVIEAIGHN